MEEIQQKFDLSPTKFINQLKDQKFPQKIDWFSPEIFSPEKPNEKSEVESLRKKLNEMKKEIDSLSARVWKLEKENKDLKETAESTSEKIKETLETINSSPEKNKETSFALPPSVASSEGKFPFDASKKISKDILTSAETIAKFIRFGIIGQMVVNGAKKDKTILLNGKLVYAPDLVKDIISTHIKDQMYKDGDQKSLNEFVEKIIMSDIMNKKINIGAKSTFLRNVRNLEEETIHNISTEFMKYI